MYHHYKNIHYNKNELYQFANSLTDWEQPCRRDNGEPIPGIKVFRYRPELMACHEIRYLASKFDVDYTKIQLYRFAPDFDYPPHVDLERKSAILFPIYPVTKYAPIYFGELAVKYDCPLAVNTQEKHAVYGNGMERINMQFDMDITLDEIRDIYI